MGQCLGQHVGHQEVLQVSGASKWAFNCQANERFNSGANVLELLVGREKTELHHGQSDLLQLARPHSRTLGWPIQPRRISKKLKDGGTWGWA